MNKGNASFRNRLAWQIDLPSPNPRPNSVHVDLGAGKNPRNPFMASKLIATDFSKMSTQLINGIEFKGCDLTEPLPFDDNSIDSFSAYDLLEHIPRWERVGDGIEFPFINLMSEVHRVLKPGGRFLAVTPAFPSPAAFQDPTHINFISDQTVDYFVGRDPHATSIGYGFSGQFTLVYQAWLRGAGPFTEEALIENCTLRSRKGVINCARVIRRLIKLISSKNSTHLVWLLEKATY